MKKYIALLLLISSVAWGGELNDQLLMLNQAKHDIKVAAEGKGVTIGNANLEDYAGIISQIPYASGGLYLDNIYMQHNAARGSIVTIEAGSDLEVTLDDQPTVVTNLGVQGMKFSENGRKFVAKARSIDYFVSYTYDGANGGWVKDAAPNLPAGFGTYFVGMSRDGSTVVVPSVNFLSIFTWSNTNNRYERQTLPNKYPVTGYGAAITDDLSRIVFTDANAGVATFVYTLAWDAVDGRYEEATPVDVQPTGRAYGCAMSADGTYMAAVHLGTTAPAKLATYKWDAVDGRYELTTAHTASFGSATVIGCSMASDGAVLATGHNASPYVTTLGWDSGTSRYVVHNAVSYGAFTAPAGAAYDVSLSDDASTLVASYFASSTANIPNFVVFNWDAGDNRYEAVATYKQDSDANPVGAAISGNGIWAASSHSDNSYPVHLYDCDVHTAKIHFNPTDGLGVDILGLGYTLQDALKDEVVPVQTIWWREALDE